LVLKPGLIVHGSATATGSGVGPRWSTSATTRASAARDTRPDWDLSAPGLRDAWDAGDLSASTAGTSSRCRLERRLIRSTVMRSARGEHHGFRSRPRDMADDAPPAGRQVATFSVFL